MRKASVLIVLVCVLLVSSCQSPKTVSQGTTTMGETTTSMAASDTSSNTTSVSTSNFSSDFSMYYYSSDSDAFTVFKANPIDKAYSKETEPTTNYGLAMLEQKYLKMWQNEVDFSAANLRKRLTKADAAAFDKQQKLWKDYAAGSITFDAHIMNMYQYGIYIGTNRQTVYTDAQIALYRERDIHLKYLTSMLEAYNAKPLPKSEWTWNKFDWPQTHVLPVYAPGSIKLIPKEELREDEYWSFMPKYRLTYYSISSEYSTLIPSKKFNAFTDLLDKKCYKDGEYVETNEMYLASFVKYFHIPKKDFEKAVEEQRKNQIKYDQDATAETFELPNADIIYTFDNDIINAYYLRANG